MANEWKSYRLEELCEFINGFAFKSTDYVPPFSDTIEVFRMGYIQRGGGFKEDDSPVFVPRKYGRNLEKYFLKPGDVTIAMTDMKDRVAILGNTAWIRDAGRFVVNQRVGCMRVSRPDLLDPRFLYFYSNWSPHVDYLRSRANSGVQVNLSTSAIKDSELTIPPLAEQKAIAAVLGALDDKIELNRRMNATLEAMARALFQSWFVDFDPVRAKLDGRPPAALDPATAALFPSHLEDSPLGHVPKGWKCGTIGELAARILEKVDDPADWASEPLIDLSRMPQRSLALGEWGLGAELTTSVTRFLPNDILFGAIRPYFHKVGIAPVSGVTNVSVFVVRARNSFDWAFLAALCSLDSTVEFATRVSKGTKMPVVGWPDFSNYSVVVPPAELRQEFADAVAPLYEGIIANIHQSRTLATLRDTLLPKLLSGDLSVAEATVNRDFQVQPGMPKP